MGLCSEGERSAEVVACCRNPANAYNHQGCANAALQIPGAWHGKYQPEKRGNSDDLDGGKDVERPAFHVLLLFDQNLFNQDLFNETLTHGVDEIRVSRLPPAGAHLAGDLTAMIR